MRPNDIPEKVVLVTGGMGYIGSHACIALAEAGFEPVILDNLSNSSRGVLDRLDMLCGRNLVFHEGDIRDQDQLRGILREHHPFAVLHFAGLKSVGESVEFPERYQDNNVTGTRCLIDAMQAEGIRRLVFSSSATVYGVPDAVPVSESAPLRAGNPYGQTKLDIEYMLAALVSGDPEWSVACLRYFNPVGAHPSGMIGESPSGVPNNLMPYITQVAVGRREALKVYGNDYPTPDGTGVRDYIHVTDLVEGHIAALELIAAERGLQQLNLGTGQGVSVLEMIRTFESVTGCSIPFQVVDRRAGDAPEVWADPTLARQRMGWRATRDLNQMCADSWRWQQGNPQGYAD